MNRRHFLAIVIAAAIAIGLAWWNSSSRAADAPAPADFSHVQVVTYASGLTGFFDTQTGMLFIYDSNLDKCAFIRKITRLGDPMQDIRDPQSVARPAPAK